MKKGLTENGWDMMCNVLHGVVDIELHTGHLYLPTCNSPDMTSTINCFTSVDPECNRINTYVAGTPDVNYVNKEGKWYAEYSRNTKEAG